MDRIYESRGHVCCLRPLLARGADLRAYFRQQLADVWFRLILFDSRQPLGDRTVTSMAWSIAQICECEMTYGFGQLYLVGALRRGSQCVVLPSKSLGRAPILLPLKFRPSPSQSVESLMDPANTVRLHARMVVEWLWREQSSPSTTRPCLSICLCSYMPSAVADARQE